VARPAVLAGRAALHCPQPGLRRGQAARRWHPGHFRAVGRSGHQQVPHPDVHAHHRMRPVHPDVRGAGRLPPGLDGERAVPAPPVEGCRGGQDPRLPGRNLVQQGAGKGGRGLNRALADAAPAELRRQLGYKTSWYGSRLIVAGRWYPSSKTCSACGGRKPSLTLAERTWTCHGCRAVHDRDVNAAINLARLGEHAAGVEARPAGSGPVAGRGAIQKTPPGGAGGKETSTPQDQPVRKTGTAPPQGEAA
jgi:hypothetical protein